MRARRAEPTAEQQRADLRPRRAAPPHHLALLYSGAAAARVHTFLTRLCAVLTAPDKPTRWVAAPLATAAAGGAGGAGGAAAAGGHAALRQLLLALVRARVRARARVS